MSVANRSVVALITIIVAIFGFISLGSLKQELIPSFEVPQAAIVTAYPGASPEVIDKQVSQVIEDAVRQTDGIVNTTSTSQSNISIVRVEYDYGTATSKVKETLAAALASIQSALPADVTPNVLSGSFDSVPIIALGVSANNGDNESIAQTLQDVAPQLFGEISGVRDVTISGIREKRVNLKLNTSLMTANGLTQQSITSALQVNGFIIPAGTISDKDGSISVEVGTPVNSLEQLKSLPLIGTKTTVTAPTTPSIPAGLAGMGGIPSGFTIPGSTTPTVSTRTVALKLSDVAKVNYEDAPTTSIARTNGKAALSISIVKTQDGNTVAVSHAVHDKIAELQKKLGAVTVVTVFDQAPYVEKSLENLSTEGLLGLSFAILVILLFLLSVRSTLVTAISIPTSVLITFIGLNQFGYSLNILTLSALTIAIGRVVDDSIVVIENINRHLSYGEPKSTAILDAVKEVAGAITAATITTVAVFLPIALVSGLIGEIFRPFAFTFAIALVASLFVSLTIVPVLAYWFLKNPKESDALKKKDLDKFAEKARLAEEEKERKSWLQRGYLPVLTWTQKRPVITIVSAFIVLVFTFALVPFLKTDFIGSSGSNGFVINQTLPAGATLKQQDEAAAKVESLLLAEKTIEVVQTSIGSSGDGRVAFGASAGGISIQATAVDGTDLPALQDKLTTKFEQDPSLGTIKFASGGGPGFGSSSTIDIKVTAPDDIKLNDAIAKLQTAMQGTPDVSEVTNSLAEKQRTLRVTVNRLAAAKLGLSEIAVGGIVSSKLKPTSIGKVNLNNVETSIYVVQTNTPDTVAEIKAIKIPTATGLVSLSSIARVEQVEVPVSITSEKGDRTAKVSLTPSGDNLGAISAEVSKRLDATELPLGVSATLGGVSADQASSFQQLGVALLAAVAIVFIVMVATFSSLIQPLILLISIPFAATGALGLLLATDTPLGVPSLIGMLLLVGVVVTNAIVLIDLINQYRKQGRPLVEAIMDGARQRLRPILMTALATIFALTPMAIGITGGGGFISQPLAIVVIGGLFSSTVLTLVIVPVLYRLVEGRKEKAAANRLAKRTKKAKAA
ncbi:efflux RND transporter permease subunit [Rhodoluna sp.]|uniref:efflux RND transporter permease subunit n=1 Tax=Rhodoluna sp. TaxID=1969481 RepID=UPI0025F4AA32|nr:efflux RND transporter permease subunit [Rhodoluna sp.]